MAIPLSNRVDLHRSDCQVLYEPRHFDDEGFEQTQRVNGATQCPQCGLWWPNIEQPDMWVQDDNDPSKNNAEGWWGGTICCECNLLMVDQMDGRAEVYQL